MQPLDNQILIVGNGRTAQRHIANLLLLGYQHSTLGDASKSGQNVADKLIKSEKDWSRLSARSWDVAFISPSEQINLEPILQLLEGGTHCLIEPGMPLTNDEAEKLKEAALLSKASLQFSFPYRWHPLAVYTCNQLTKELNGDFLSFEVQRIEPNQDLITEPFEAAKCYAECADILLFITQAALQSTHVVNASQTNQSIYLASVNRLNKGYTGAIQIASTPFEPAFILRLRMAKQDWELDLHNGTLKIRRNSGTQLFQPEAADKNRLYIHLMVEFLEKCGARKPLYSVKEIEHYLSIQPYN